MDTQSGGGRPQLKKIKRPINRSAPLSSSRPTAAGANPFASQAGQSSVSAAPASPEIDIDNYLDELGITHELSAPYTPQQNGVVERKNRTLAEMARTMLDEYKMPHRFWIDAIDTAF